MYLSDVIEAKRQAEITQRAIEDQAKGLAKLLSGNLRNVTKDGSWQGHNLLVALKRELTQYDAKLRRWKS